MLGGLALGLHGRQTRLKSKSRESNCSPGSTALLFESAIRVVAGAVEVDQHQTSPVKLPADVVSGRGKRLARLLHPCRDVLSSLISAFAVLLVVAIVVLLVVSLRNTWDLLVTVGEVTLGGGRDQD
jgi:hypothetical protein